jgi:PAS domain S-box-containing protein
MQLPSFRGRPAVLLLVAAAVADAAWEIMWLASWWKGRDLVGLFYNFGDVLCFAAIISAVAASQFATSPASDGVNPERRADSFLPALAVLVAIALVAGSVATTRRWHAWILVGLVALSAFLLLTRQQSVRRELRALNRQLAKREADERLTELVRRSTDLILVVNAEGIVSFASPATESMLGLPVSHVQDTPAVEVLGPDHAPVLGHFLEQVRAPSAAPLTIEIRTHRPGGKDQIFKVGAVNRLANHLIGGIVLTLTDVTEQRLLEREVLDIATRERVRLSADIHDGLGQELVGISMLLHGAAAAPDPDPAVHKSQLQTIVGHVNRTVGMARSLARGLSPLHVVRGSLGGALQRLVPESNTSVSVRLDIDPAFDTYIVGDIYADHLYRIAHEAVSNALRHSGCTGIDIGLRRLDSAVVLSVSDDGRGFCEPFPEHTGLGLRLMEYRARIVGGSLSVDSAPGSGTRVKVVMPQTI